MRKKRVPKENQLEDVNKWVSYFEEHDKLPYNEVFCSHCKRQKVKLGKAKLSSLLEKLGIKDVLTNQLCPFCKKFEKDNQKMVEKKENKKEKPVPVKRFLSREEMEDRAEEIRKDLPKVNLNKPRNIIDLTKSKEYCIRETKSNCIRPDIFLKNRDCDDCHLNHWCVCPIKKFSKNYEKR